MNSKALGGGGNWWTPLWFIQWLYEKGCAYNLDAAANERSRICRNYIDEKRDAFATPWRAKRVFCNPPWARGQIERFFRRAEAQLENFEVCEFLVPAKPWEGWFQYMVRSRNTAQVVFLSPRLNYIDPKTGLVRNGIAFGSALITITRGSHTTKTFYERLPDRKEKKELDKRFVLR